MIRGFFLCPSQNDDAQTYMSMLSDSYYSFELAHDPVIVRDSMVSSPWVPIIVVTLYGLGCIGGRMYFKDRPAWDWRRTMALWNLGLSVFSFVGLIRTLPQLIHNYTNYTVTENLCIDPESNFGSGATGLWVQLFCLSKIPYV
jgi:hypothetical protein